MTETIFIKVKAGAKQNKIEGWLEHGGQKYLKVSIKQMPEDGKANKAVIKFLAKEFKIPQNSLGIVSGHASGYKALTIIK